jgi:hypothetical protein
MIAAVLAAMATQSGALLQPPWEQGQLVSKGEYARYGELEPDGTYSIVHAIKNVCNCKVSNLQADFIKDLTAPGVTVTHSATTMCGQSADHVVAVGAAKASDKSTYNDDVFIFREGPAAYIFMYSFRYPHPVASEEHALTAFCP